MHINANDHTTFDKLADDKATLRRQCEYALATYRFLGGKVTVCPTIDRRIG